MKYHVVILGCIFSFLSPASGDADTFYKFTGNVFQIYDRSSDQVFGDNFSVGESVSYVVRIDESELAMEITDNHHGREVRHLPEQYVGYTNYYADYICGDAIMEGYYDYEYYRAYDYSYSSRSGVIVGERLDITGSTHTIAEWSIGDLFEVKNYRAFRPIDGSAQRWLYVKDAVLERVISSPTIGHLVLSELCPNLSYEERIDVCLETSLLDCDNDFATANKTQYEPSN